METLPAPRVPLRLDDQAGKVLAIVEDGPIACGSAERRAPPLRPRQRESPLVWTAGPSGRGDLAGRLIRTWPSACGEIWVLTHASAGSSGQAPHSLFRVDPDRLTARQATMRERVARPGGDASPDRLAIDRSGVLWWAPTVRSPLRGRELRRVLLFPGSSEDLGAQQQLRPCRLPGRDGAVWVGTPHGLDRIDRSGGQVRYRKFLSGRAAELPP